MPKKEETTEKTEEEKAFEELESILNDLPQTLQEIRKDIALIKKVLKDAHIMSLDA